MPFTPDRWAELLRPATELTAPRGLIGESPTLGHPKPVWALDVVGQVIEALVAGSAAIARGQLVGIGDNGARLLEDGQRRINLLGGPTGTWACPRPQGQAWADYVATSADVARISIERIAGVNEGAGEIFVDLAWITPDEPVLYDLPGYVRAGYERARLAGDFAAPAARSRERHLREAKPGSFHGTYAETAGEIPPDARYAKLIGTAKDVDRLGALQGLEVLSLRWANDASLAAVARLPRLRILEIHGIRGANLDALADHPALEMLFVHEAARLRNADAVATIPGLHTLSIDLSGIKSAAPLAGLKTIESLRVTATPSYLPDYQPLSALTSLRHLHVAVRNQDKSLAPLHGLTALQSIQLPDSFTVEELAALAAALPATRGLPDSAVFTTALSQQLSRCRKCGGRDVVLTTGSPVRELCRACDDAAIRKHALRWEMALAAAGARPIAAREAEPPPADDYAIELHRDESPGLPKAYWVPTPRPPAAGEIRPAVPPRPAFTPAPEHGRILEKWGQLGGAGSGEVEDFAALFEGGLCDACGAARGPRTSQQVVFKYVSDSRHYNGVQIRAEPFGGAIILLFSEELIQLLSPEEQAVLQWRPTTCLSKGKKVMHELVGSSHHFVPEPLAGAPEDPRVVCEACGLSSIPSYESVTSMPTWLDPHADGKNRLQPSYYLGSDVLSDPKPACFTFGDWRSGVAIALPEPRWRTISKHKAASGAGTVGWPTVGIVHPAVLLR